MLLVVALVLLTNVANAQWVGVDGEGRWCFAYDGTYIYAGDIGGVSISGDTTAPRTVVRSSDGGTSWVNVSSGLTSGTGYSLRVFSFAVTGDELLAGTDYGIFISTDHGDNWTGTNFDPSLGEVHAFLVEDSLIFAGSDAGQSESDRGGIFLSTDLGRSWSRSDSGLSVVLPNQIGNKRIYALTKIGSKLFAGNWDNGVFISNDNGLSWSKSSRYTDAWEVTSFGVVDSTLFAGLWDDVFRSSDMGTSWVRCDSGLTDTTYSGYAVQSLAVSGRDLIAGTMIHGVFLSTNMGESWKPINDSLGVGDSLSFLTYDIFSLAIIDDYLFAGTGRGIWRRPLSDITSVKKKTTSPPKKFELEQNYPNPFNPSTAIRYHLSAVSDVTLKVYDLLGREVATIVSEKEYAGTHLLHFDGSWLASGVYFFRLIVDGHAAIKKMVLIK